MAIDMNRGSFVLKEYRYETKDAPEVLARQPNARTIKLETNLDSAAAKALAVELMTEHQRVAQAYRVKVAGVDIASDDKWVDSPPTFSCVFPDWPISQVDVLRTVTTTTDYNEFSTTITAKGPQ
jgi:hypothetical protein